MGVSPYSVACVADSLNLDECVGRLQRKLISAVTSLNCWKQLSLPWAGKHTTCQILLQKVELLSTLCYNFPQLATTWANLICYKRGLIHGSGEKHPKSLQCGKTIGSFFIARFTKPVLLAQLHSIACFFNFVFFINTCTGMHHAPSRHWAPLYGLDKRDGICRCMNKVWFLSSLS